MKIQIIRTLIFSLIFSLSPSMVWADAVDALSARFYFRTYQANFIQFTEDDQGKIIQRGQGRVKILRPGYFRWESDTPTHQLLITDGKTLWTYNVDLAQATQQPLYQKINVNPATLLSGSVSDLKQQFMVQMRVFGTQTIFVLRPKSSAINFHSLQLTFRKNGLIAMKVRNNLDETSTFQFRQIKLNAPLSVRLFQFKPPPGVDVVNPS